MRFLGIDYGGKRIGIAVSDEQGKIAFPHGVVAWSKNAVAAIRAIARRERAGVLVVGLPLGFDGSETGQTRKARTFAERLEKDLRLPVRFENEMFTTRMARASGADNEHVDESSAALILQSYLDQKNQEADDSYSSSLP